LHELGWDIEGWKGRHSEEEEGLVDVSGASSQNRDFGIDWWRENPGLI
jgi:hypothetical protein